MNMKQKGGYDIVQVGMSKKVKQINKIGNSLSSVLNEDNITVSENNYDRTEIYKYYSENLATSNGPYYLVEYANFETDNACHHMSIDETHIHLEMIKFSSTLSLNQRLRFASILSKVY